MRYSTIRKVQLNEPEAIAGIREHAHVLHEMKEIDALLNRIGDARIVMLGEASHGTHEYYTWRNYITQKLIREKGFHFIAVEGDWPDCYRVNRFIKNYAEAGSSPYEILQSFNRWPTWMWANWEIVAMTEWLYHHNKNVSTDKKVGFYGLDVYSLWESMEAIMKYLKRIDSQALKTAKEAFICFEPFRHDEGRSYAKESQLVPELCEDEVVNLLKEVRRKIPTYDGDTENVFNVDQNALITVNAEKYYRAMVKGGPDSWNIRDRHMTETLERLLHYHGTDSKVIVWEHNAHIGDARATSMANEGMFNIGELIRMQHNDVVLVGFGSYKGTVIAARNWGGSIRTMDVPSGRKGSWEYLLHQAGQENKLLIMDDFMKRIFLENYIDHRAIGVVYNPDIEMYGNYVPSILPMRYDAFVYLDRTSALHPLHIQPNGHLVPETYPFGV